MIRVREDVEHEIWWQQKEGNASFWMDNRTKQGALYYIEPQGVEEEVEAKELIQNGQWDIARLQQLLSQDMVECIVDSIGPKLSVGTQDKAWWMGISIEGVQLQQLITIWWDWPGQYKSEVSVDKRKDSELEGDAHHSSAYKPTLYYRIVYWEKPDQEWVKSNTDGACKENPGQSSYGFIIRNSRGDLIYAEAQKIGEATNMEAEIMGVLKAMQYCETQNFQKIILETYSLVLTNVLVKQWRIPWLHAENIENIQQSIARKQVQIIWQTWP
ncbi:hypothetical protein KY289_016218 [Solanum tuberosum]|nr:hypothetical protein KY289_016218 [Solanum tuberosum]